MIRNFTGKLRAFIFYLLFFAGAAALYNFLALYYAGKGLPGSQIGVLMGVSSLIGLAAGPLWSGLADATNRHRLVLSIAMLGNLSAVFIFSFGNTFWWFLALIILQSLFGGPIISMADNATMAMLGDEKDLYGRVRIGGTIGWGLAAPIVGVVVGRYGLSWTFSIYSALLLIALLVGQGLHFSHRRIEGSYSHGVRELLSDRKWIVFLFIVFTAGCGNAAITSYLFLYLQKIGTSLTWMGLAISIATAAEFPALFYADRLMKRFSARGLLTIGLIGTAVRCGLYGVVSLPWLALTVQLVQAVTFPILLVAGVSYAHENALPGMGATAQSIFSSAFTGFGSAAGGFLGGMLIEYVGVQQMFLVFGVVILLAGFIFGFMQNRESGTINIK
jgi:PPP family 3-phenylpropionic acid transporter